MSLLKALISLCVVSVLMPSAFAAVGCVASGCGAACTLANSDVVNYNISTLERSTDYYIAAVSSMPASFSMNFCRASTYQYCNAPVSPSASVYITGTGSFNCKAVGFVAQTSYSALTEAQVKEGLKGFSVLFSSNGGFGNTQVDIICSETDATSPVYVSNTGGTVPTFMFRFMRRAGCPVVNDDGLSGGWIFIIILVVVTVVYCAAGIGFRAWKGERGMEMIPHRELCAEIPGLVKDGMFYTWAKVTRQEGYATMRA